MSVGTGEAVGLLLPQNHALVCSATGKESSTYGAIPSSVAVVQEETGKGGSWAVVSEREVVSSLYQKRHYRNFSKESGFETDLTRRSSTASFSSSEELEDLLEEFEGTSSATSKTQEAGDTCSAPCKTQDTSSSVELGDTSSATTRIKTQKLFDYMEVHTKQVEQELRKVSVAIRGGQPTEEDDYEDVSALDVNSTVLAINSEEGDFETISISTEYVSVEDERKQYRSAFGVLYNLKREIWRLKDYFDSECTKLDRFVMGADSNPEGAERLLGENSMQQERFNRRLDDCMEGVGQQMEDIRNKNDVIINGVRMRSPNRKFSESAINRLIRKSPVGCVTWLHGFLFLALFAMISYLYLWSRSSNQWTVCLRLVRSPLMVVLLCYLYGINMKVWAMYKVDYVTIFSHHPSSTPTPRYIFRVASTLTVLMGVLVAALVIATPFSKALPLKIAPIAMWLVLLVFLLNPFDIFMRKVRFNLCLSFVRIMISPLVFVYFADFFLADQFNSTVAIFLDVQYLVCYLVVGPWAGDKVDPKQCTSSGNGIRPIVSLLPACWRFLQCLRCYYDTRNISHLVNAGKYFTTLPVIVFATFYSTMVKGDIRLQFIFNDVGWIVILLLLSSFVHSVYTFTWDVSRDWGLWNLKCTLFNRKLVYQRKLVYLLAIGLDFVFRFLWTAKLTLAIVWEKDSDLIYTGM